MADTKKEAEKKGKDKEDPKLYIALAIAGTVCGLILAAVLGYKFHFTLGLGGFLLTAYLGGNAIAASVLKLPYKDTLQFKYSKPQVADGQTCEVNKDCKNDKCGLISLAKNAPKVCCAEIVKKGDKTYCNKQTDNEGCWANNWCEGGYCRNTKNETQVGKCGKGGVAEVCEVKGDCTNDTCANIVKGGETKQECCPSANMVKHGGKDWCSKLQDNAVCYIDEMCETGSCRDNDNGDKQGTCGKVAKDGKCERNINCTSGHCGYKTLDAKEMTCCPDGTVKAGEYDYCNGLEIGDNCLLNDMCKSKKCSTNDGKTHGKCIA
jgi:hypothetical protein